jgi:hypothetical protein
MYIFQNILCHLFSFDIYTSFNVFIWVDYSQIRFCCSHKRETLKPVNWKNGPFKEGMCVYEMTVANFEVVLLSVVPVCWVW